MRSHYIALLFVFGCSAKTAGGEDPSSEPEPDPKGWTISVDMSGLDRFVQPVDATTWQVGGSATATEGLASVTVGGAPVELDANGAFATSVPVMPGLNPIAILATDEAGHTRKGDRTLLSARFLPDAAHNLEAARLVLDDTILGAMSEGIAAYGASVNVAAEILARDVLSQDDRFVTWPVSAQQGTVTTILVEDQGNLWLRIRIPNLYVYFQGSCRGLLSNIPIAGEMGGTLDVWTRLTARPPEGGGCLTSFAHTMPQVIVNGWGFDVWGTSGPLQAWMIEMFSGSKSTEARDQLAGEVRTRAHQLLGTQLANVSVLDRKSQLSLLGRPVELALCVGNLSTIGGKLVAQIAARASSAGTRAAPGTPQIDGPQITPAPNELVLDANLIAQLLHASWRDGGLTRPAPDADVSIIQIQIPELAREFPDGTIAQIHIDAELPPLVRATPDGPADLRVELGDLMISLSMSGKPILEFGATLVLALDLVPMDGALMPTVVESSATVVLLDERHDGNDAALEEAIRVKIGATAAQLLGDGAAIALPDLPGLGAPTDVLADPGGRFLRVKLAP